MPANAGQQVRGGRAERGDDQGRVRERTQQVGHGQVHGVIGAALFSSAGVDVTR